MGTQLSPPPFLGLVLIACIFYAVPRAQSQSTGVGDTTFYQLGIDELTSSVTVASNIVTDKEKQPVSITTITREQLLSSGARQLSEAIMMYVPGFFLVEDHDDQIAAFRGLAADNNSKVLLLVDGQNVNTEFFWGPADALLNSTNYAYIERVEVIRGPGSVTLGQGALLGVINIVTRSPQSLEGTKVAKSDVQFNVGPDNTFHGSADVLLKNRDLSSYFYISTNRYGGQPMREEGWIAQKANEGYAGGKVAGMGHHLHRNDNMVMSANIKYKGFSLNVIHADQIRDLYNFYRDREIFEQEMTSVAASYTQDFGSRVSWKNTVSYAQDHFSLSSLTGAIMGGTREDRFGIKSLFTLDEVIANNKMAIGFEARQFRMGKENMLGNNFIANVVGSFDPVTANEQLSMGFRKNITVVSFFLEDYHSINDQLSVFFALRNDNHPFWGNSFTPRLGAIYNPIKPLRFRFSYQSGFRGAVGLHYTGGFRRDGFMRVESYGQVSEAGIPVFSPEGEPTGEMEPNIPEPKPERMNSLELEANYQPNKALNFNLVGFYNSISNVIDVGVIYRDPSRFEMVDIGNDIPGDWNGYWFFKNTPGNFRQVGLEASFNYTAFDWEIGMSHSLTRVVQATAEQEALARSGSSMYLASGGDDNLHFKAYPESVTRIHGMAKPIDGLRLGLNALAYGRWYSPSGSEAPGGVVLNASASYQISKNVALALTGRNLLNEDALYPMNSNSGGPDVSPGTPAWEETTFWATLRLTLQ